MRLVKIAGYLLPLEPTKVTNPRKILANPQSPCEPTYHLVRVVRVSDLVSTTRGQGGTRDTLP